MSLASIRFVGPDLYSQTTLNAYAAPQVLVESPEQAEGEFDEVREREAPLEKEFPQ